MAIETMSREALLHELIAVYDFLNEAYWLALRQLTQGGVPVGDQWSFWTAFQSLDDLRDGDLSESASDSREGADRRPAADDNPFYVRAYALRDVLCSDRDGVMHGD